MIILVMASALCVGLFSLGYKVFSIKNYNSNLFLLLYAMSFSFASFMAALISNESIYNKFTITYGIANGFSMYIAIFVYTHVVKYVKLNISWTIIQFSILIPILISTIVYKELPGIFFYTGGLFIILAIIIFQKSKADLNSSGPKIKNYKIIIMLFLTTLFTGIANTIPKIYVEKHNDAGNFSMLFFSGITILIFSTFNLLCTNGKESKSISKGLIKLSVYMGFTQVSGLFLLLVSLRYLPGIIVYPLRNIISLIVVYIFSYLIFKEKLNRYEVRGVIFSLLAIVLISMSL
jgi:drug/metabolite transporter (DMT)-like permease